MRESAGHGETVGSNLQIAAHSVVATTRPRAATLWGSALLGPYAADVRREISLDGGRILLVYDVLETLEDVLDVRKRLGPAELGEIADVVFGYLERLHGLGRSHGALSPSAIVRSPAGFWSVLPPIADGLVMAAVPFDAPEGPGEPAADVFSATAVLAMAACGRLVTSRAVLSSALGTGAMPLLAGLEPDPRQRPSAADSAVSFGQPSPAGTEHEAASHRWVWAVIGILAVAATGVGFKVLHSPTQIEQQPAVEVDQRSEATTIADATTTVAPAPVTTVAAVVTTPATVAATVPAPVTTVTTTAPAPTTAVTTRATPRPTTTAAPTTQPADTTLPPDNESRP